MWKQCKRCIARCYLRLWWYFSNQKNLNCSGEELTGIEHAIIVRPVDHLSLTITTNKKYECPNKRIPDKNQNGQQGRFQIIFNRLVVPERNEHPLHLPFAAELAVSTHFEIIAANFDLYQELFGTPSRFFSNQIIHPVLVTLSHSLKENIVTAINFWLSFLEKDFGIRLFQS